MPTQLLKLNGDQRSLLQSTFVRLARSVQPERINMLTSTANYRQCLSKTVSWSLNIRRPTCWPNPSAATVPVLWGDLRLNRHAPDTHGGYGRRPYG